jgi:hypothetical protein
MKKNLLHLTRRRSSDYYVCMYAFKPIQMCRRPVSRYIFVSLSKRNKSVNENIIRGRASKVPVNSYGTDGGDSFLFPVTNASPNLRFPAEGEEGCHGDVRTYLRQRRWTGFPRCSQVPVEPLQPTRVGQLRVEQVKWERGKKDQRDLIPLLAISPGEI